MKTLKRSRKADVVLSVIVLLLVAFGGVTGWKQLQMRRVIAQRALREARLLQPFQNNIGKTAQTGWYVSGRVTGGMDGGTADLLVPVIGPKGHGKLAAWMQGSYSGWHVCSMELITDDGKRIDLMPDEQAHCERE
jgi:hypothetical protein